MAALLIVVSGGSQAQRRLPDAGPPFVELASLPVPAVVTLSDGADTAGLDAALSSGREADALGLAELMLNNLPAEAVADRVLALRNLAVVHLQMGQTALAGARFAQALTLLDETGADNRDPLRIDLLHGLGLVAYRQQRYLEARDFFRQSQFVARASLGLTSLEQMAPLQALVETQLALGAYETATQRASAQLALINQAHGESSDEAFAQVDRAADVYGRVGWYAGQRRLLRNKLNLIRRTHGNGDWRQVETLRQLALTYRAEYLPELYGVTDLELAIEIADEHPERFDAVERARLQRDLGDYYMTFMTPRQANRLYGKAYDLLAEAGRDDVIKRWFAQPQPLFVPRPAAVDGASEIPAAGLPEGHVAFRFAVTVQGRVQGLETHAVVPPAAADMRLSADRAMRDARFRPAVTARGPVFTSDVEHRLRFRYRPTVPDTPDPGA